MGIIPDHAVLPPHNSEPGGLAVRPWAELSEREQRLFARYMAVYAAMIDCVDQNVGRLRAFMESIDEWQDTVFLFLSDNGAAQSGREIGTSHALRGLVQSLTPGDYSPMSRFEEDYRWLEALGGPRTFPDYPAGWAQASNTPFRLYKTFTFAGGHQVPMIIAGPGGISDPGAVRHQYAYVTDVLPTLVQIADLDVPGTRAGAPAMPFTGTSFSHWLRSPAGASGHTEQYYEMWGQRGYYRIGWDAVTFHVPRTPFSADHWQLFNLGDDPTQTTDLAEERPDLALELSDAWERAAWENQVFPLDERVGLSQLGPPDRPDPAPITIRPGDPRSYAASRLLAQRSFTISARIDYKPGDRGVIVAWGGQGSGGLLLYVENDELYFAYNFYGDMRRLDGGRLSPGERVLVVEAHAPGGNMLDIALMVDGREVAAASVPMLVAVLTFSAGMGVDVGVSRLSPVDWDIWERHGTYRYQGLLRSVTVAAGPRPPDRGPHLREELMRAALALQ
jgi:hypothetical protein